MRMDFRIQYFGKIEFKIRLRVTIRNARDTVVLGVKLFSLSSPRAKQYFVMVGLIFQFSSPKHFCISTIDAPHYLAVRIKAVRIQYNRNIIAIHTRTGMTQITKTHNFKVLYPQ
jgi:hypothetical protein